jgi:acyl-CoA thioester hydrolase
MTAERFNPRLRVRYSECDPQGVVFNGWYLFYYDVALTEFHREVIGRYSELSERGQEIVVAAASVQYRAPARFDDWLDISLSIARFGRTSFEVNAEFMRAARLVATAQVRHVLIEATSGSKAELPQAFREALAPFLTE